MYLLIPNLWVELWYIRIYNLYQTHTNIYPSTKMQIGMLFAPFDDLFFLVF